MRVVCVVGGDGLDAGRAVRVRMALRPAPRGVEVAASRHGALALREALDEAVRVALELAAGLGALEAGAPVASAAQVPPVAAV